MVACFPDLSYSVLQPQVFERTSAYLLSHPGQHAWVSQHLPVLHRSHVLAFYHRLIFAVCIYTCSSVSLFVCLSGSISVSLSIRLCISLALALLLSLFLSAPIFAKTRGSLRCLCGTFRPLKKISRLSSLCAKACLRKDRLSGPLLWWYIVKRLSWVRGRWKL